MHIHDDEWIIKASEIDAIVEKAACGRGLLTVLPSFSEQGAAADRAESPQKPSSADVSDSELLEACICVLANPQRVVRMHSNVADSTVSRSIIASGAALPGVWVTLTGSAEPFRISMRSDPELRYLIKDMLAADSTAFTSQISCDLSTEAALVLMACLDQSRRSWLVSLLKHLEPISIFSLEEIKFCLSEGSIEDFRWTLPLVDKLLPIALEDMTIAEDPRPAILELIEAGLIEPVNEEADIFDWTEAGRVLSEGNRQAAGRLVLAQSFLLPDEDAAHDIMLFTRTPLDIFLIILSGADASLISMLPGDLNELLEQVFVVPLTQQSEPMPVETEPAELPDNASKAMPTRHFCTHCGSQLMEKAKFCMKCGTPVNR